MNEEKYYFQLLKRTPYKAPILLPTKKIPLKERISGVEKVIEISENRWKKEYVPKLKAIREKLRGTERCFVIGNGPSLNKTDLSPLKTEISFAVNGIFLKFEETDFRPTFYVVEDHLVAEDRRDKINTLQGITKFFPIYLSYCLNDDEDTIFYNHRPRVSYPHGFDFSTDASKITYTGCTVLFSCLQLAVYFGIKNIYLIGVDLNYKLPETTKKSSEYNISILDMSEDDPNHFHRDYFGKGYRWHDPQEDKMKEAFAEAKHVCDQIGVKIYNATIGGQLEIFPRVDYYSLFEQYEKPRPIVLQKRFELKRYFSKFTKNSEEKLELIEKYYRGAHAQFDEGQFVYELLSNQTSDSVMIDVGAHQGGSIYSFAKKGWRIYAFEPDPVNREKLLKRIEGFPLVYIDSRAVTDKVIESTPFYSSKESTGISCLTPFRDTHQEICRVSTTTLSGFCKEQNITSVDFLKIDTEGYDLMVLKGFPWESFKPRIILCEFEDSKTVPLDYDFHQMAQFLIEKGFTVFVSEWHPIIRYGISHDWCRLVTYPCELTTPDAWGNLIAFREKPDMEKITIAARNNLKFRQKELAKKDLSKQREQEQKNMNQDIFNVSVDSKRAFSKNVKNIKSSFFSNFYQRFAQYLMLNYPPLARIGMFVVWSLRALKRRIFGLSGLTFLFIAGFFVAAYFFEDYRWLFISAGSGIVLFVAGVLGVAYAQYHFRSFRDVQRNEIQLQLNQLVKESVQQSGKELHVLREQLETTAKEVTDAIRKNEARSDAKVQQVHQELNQLVKESVQQSGKELHVLREQLETTAKAVTDALQKNETRSEAMVQGMRETLVEFVKKSEKIVNDQVVQLNTNYVKTEKILKELHEKSRQALEESQKALSAHFEITSKANFLNAGIYQYFNRYLQNEHIQRILEFWLPSLALESLDRKALGYMAHRICQVENNCSGRLATTVQDAILRVLAAQSVTGQKLEILEIGALFGISLAMIYDNCRGRFDSIHLTAIDPLEGYYDNSAYDIGTMTPINRTLFEHNIRITDIPKKDVTLIQSLSTEKQAQEAALKRSYHVLIIDGDHSYKGVKFDFDHYHQMVEKGGYIIFDDYNCKEWPDVTKFVENEVKKNTNLKLVGSDWSTAVFKVEKKRNIRKKQPTN